MKIKPKTDELTREQKFVRNIKKAIRNYDMYPDEIDWLNYRLEQFKDENSTKKTDPNGNDK
jgi:hypothetical protein